MKPLEFLEELMSFFVQRTKSQAVEITRILGRYEQKSDAIQSREQEIHKDIEHVKSILSQHAPGHADNLWAARDYLKTKLEELTKSNRELDDCLLQKEIDYKRTSERVKELKNQLHEIEDLKEELTHELNGADIPLTLKLMKSSRINQQ